LTAKVAPYKKDKCTPFTFLVVHNNSDVRNQKIVTICCPHTGNDGGFPIFSIIGVV
jgi:hypothetical protein